MGSVLHVAQKTAKQLKVTLLVGIHSRSEFSSRSKATLIAAGCSTKTLVIECSGGGSEKGPLWE